jgi:uncharacterized lipoprotein YmbA
MKRLFFVVLLVGCSFFSKTKNQIYSLDRIPGAPVAVTGAPVGIDAIELPPGFDRKEIVVRKANSQLDVRGTQQWGAVFSEEVLHTLASDLASRLPAGMMIMPGAAKPATMRNIDVAFEELAAGPDARVVLEARWERTHHERIEVPIASLDSANVATGTSQALAQLAARAPTAPRPACAPWPPDTPRRSRRRRWPRRICPRQPSPTDRRSARRSAGSGESQKQPSLRAGRTRPEREPRRERRGRRLAAEAMRQPPRGARAF